MNADTVITHGIQGIDWKEVAAVYERARTCRRAPEELEAAFSNSFATVFAWRGGKVIAAARALSDGVYCATVVDVAVHPDHQRLGIGTGMMAALLSRLPFDKIYLTAVQGKEGFYEKFGFQRQNGAMGLYSGDALRSALDSGVLSAA